jgi:acyl carrier protein
MQKIIDIVSGILGVPVTENTTMEDVKGWDSMRTLQIVMALDEAGLPIPIERIAEIRSVADVIRFAGQGNA